MQRMHLCMCIHVSLRARRCCAAAQSVSNLPVGAGPCFPPPSHGMDPQGYVRRRVQREVGRALLQPLQPGLNRSIRRNVERQRHHITRVEGRINHEHTTRMIERNHTTVKAQCPPRVWAVAWRTIWNGWCTSRRFQSAGPCRFGCRSLGAADSLEHYSCCDKIWSAGTEFADVPHHCHRKPSYFLIMNDDADHVITGIAWMIYGALRVYDQLRHDTALTAEVYERWDPLLDSASPPLSPSSASHGATHHCIRRFIGQRDRNAAGTKRGAPATATGPAFAPHSAGDFPPAAGPARGRRRFGSAAPAAHRCSLPLAPR